MRLNNTRVSFTINQMDFLVDGDRRYLPLENGYFIQESQARQFRKHMQLSFFVACFALFAYAPVISHSESSILILISIIQEIEDPSVFQSHYFLV
jgi:hypothetical protein